ncbi:MAG: esterase-like activity of phytase family protein [Croceibacterium sp.]
MRRLIAILAVALLLAPGTFLRSPPEPFNPSQSIRFTRLALPPQQVGETQLQAMWQLTGPHSKFGGFSALLLLGDGQFLAASDAGAEAWFPRPQLAGGFAAGATVRIGDFGGRREEDKARIDIESLAQDPATGRIWAGYESQNAIVRYEPGLHSARWSWPVQMRAWALNAGPEAFVRLRDGRFIVLEEGKLFFREPDSGGLLYPGDPVDGMRAVEFRYAPPAGFRPVDLAQSPDGRVLILLRDVDARLPPHFHSALAVADPAAIRPGQQWRGRVIAEIDDPLPTDNFEGMALRPLADGSVQIWLISDDNFGHFQRTYLTALRWRPR